jgi:hypothetical protein
MRYFHKNNYSFIQLQSKVMYSYALKKMLTYICERVKKWRLNEVVHWFNYQDYALIIYLYQ